MLEIGNLLLMCMGDNRVMSKYVEITNASGQVVLSDSYVPMTIKELSRFRNGIHKVMLDQFYVLGCDGKADIELQANGVSCNVSISNATADVVVYSVSNTSSSRGEFVVYDKSGHPIYSNRDSHIAVANISETVRNINGYTYTHKFTNNGAKFRFQQDVVYEHNISGSNAKKYISISPFFGIESNDGPPTFVNRPNF